MAVATPSQTQTQERSSISKFISRIRSRGERASPERPNDTRPPLKDSPLPLVLPDHQRAFQNLGWTTVTFPQPRQPNSSENDASAPGPHPLQKAYQDLFAASQKFFESPEEEKLRWKHKLGSEEGWSKIEGEKEFITLRTLSYTPDVLKEPAKRYWDLMGNYLDTCLGRISTSLNISDGEDEGLRRYVGPCKTMGQTDERDKTSTMLRLFRYEGWEEKVVAEPHADLGLLSCVVGDIPGLEVWDGRAFWGVERQYTTPCATLLGGRQLERLSNFRFPAGGHRVVSYGRPEAQKDEERPRFRFSIVFVLRAHEPVIVDTESLTTDVTGEFKTPVNGVSVGEWYERIRNAHFNINTGMSEREEQRRKLEEKKKQVAMEAKGAGTKLGFRS